MYRIVILSILLIGCNLGDSARKALATAEAIQTQTITKLDEFDKRYQQEIVEHAIDANARQEAMQILKNYRIKRNVIIQLLIEEGALFTEGSALISLFEQHVKSRAELVKWLNDLFTIAEKIKNILATFDWGIVK